MFNIHTDSCSFPVSNYHELIFAEKDTYNKPTNTE